VRTGERSGVGRWILIGALVIAIALTAAILQPVWRSAGGFSDPRSLPAQISMCGRQWKRDDVLPPWSAADPRIAGRMTVVRPGPFGLLTACPWPHTSFVSTVIFVRIGDDAYVDYSLRGGP
jgi:hypothetical protein